MLRVAIALLLSLVFVSAAWSDTPSSSAETPTGTGQPVALHLTRLRAEFAAKDVVIANLRQQVASRDALIVALRKRVAYLEQPRRRAASSAHLSGTGAAGGPSKEKCALTLSQVGVRRVQNLWIIGFKIRNNTDGNLGPLFVTLSFDDGSSLMLLPVDQATNTTVDVGPEADRIMAVAPGKTRELLFEDVDTLNDNTAKKPTRVLVEATDYMKVPEDPRGCVPHPLTPAEIG